MSLFGVNHSTGPRRRWRFAMMRRYPGTIVLLPGWHCPVMWAIWLRKLEDLLKASRFIEDGDTWLKLNNPNMTEFEFLRSYDWVERSTTAIFETKATSTALKMSVKPGYYFNSDRNSVTAVLSRRSASNCCSEITRTQNNYVRAVSRNDEGKSAKWVT